MLYANGKGFYGLLVAGVLSLALMAGCGGGGGGGGSSSTSDNNNTGTGSPLAGTWRLDMGDGYHNIYTFTDAIWILPQVRSVVHVAPMALIA